MQFRESLLNLAITCVLVLIVVLAALLMKESRTEPVAAVPVTVAPPADGGSGSLREVSPAFVALANPELVDSRANEADTLRIKSGGEEFIFALYFADALETSLTNSSRVAEQARWFGGIHPQKIVEGGQEAMAYTGGLLKQRLFSVLTRWERVPNTSRYYALIVVEYAPGKRAYLADLLVRKGYARVAGITTFLPESDKRKMEDYLIELQGLAKTARLKREGIWSKS